MNFGVLAAILTLLLAQQAPVQPYKDFTEAGSGFYGYGREEPDPEGLESIRIGILAPEKDPEGLQMRIGVQVALDEANARGGYQQIPYEAVFRADDGPWGMAARQVVDLIYEDNVWAIIGGLDGNRTHLAELVVSKAWTPVISPVAADSSVDYANVPWVFRCAPSDTRQAEKLIDYARKRGHRHIVALTEMDRESYTGYLRLRNSSITRQQPLAAHFQFPTHTPEMIVSRLYGSPLDALVIWGSPASVTRLIAAVRSAGFDVPILAPATLATPGVAASRETMGELIVAAPYDMSLEDSRVRWFVEEFRRKTGLEPSPTALFSYDAACLVVKAIENSGLNRIRIRDELTEMDHDGLTGSIRFNSLRANVADPVLMTLRDGKWVKVPVGAKGTPETASVLE
jgi:branched-chain amino acid transport system substrate-binding protein